MEANGFKIEKNVPPPVSDKNTKWPLAQIQPGDSFLVPPEKALRVRYAASQFVRRTQPKWRFATRTVKGGLRIWRVK